MKKENIQMKPVSSDKRALIEKSVVAVIFAVVLFIVFIGFAKILDLWSEGFNFFLPSISLLLALIGVLSFIRKKTTFAIIYWVTAVLIFGFFIGVQIYRVNYWN
jgi:phosphoglycerol transferase MdoB-like AlkP superfamily enzyme